MVKKKKKVEPENSSLRSCKLGTTYLLSLVYERKSWDEILEKCEICTLIVLGEKIEFLIPGSPINLPILQQNLKEN